MTDRAVKEIDHRLYGIHVVICRSGARNLFKFVQRTLYEFMPGIVTTSVESEQ